MRAHYARLCNFAARFLGSGEVVEDIVQDVFLAIWQRRVEFRYGDPLPYLYQAVRNRAVMHARRMAVRQRWVEREEIGDRARESVDAAASVEAAELSRRIEEALGSLPHRCRLIFTMSREQDLTYAEIARTLGISVKTVEVHMGRALKNLRTHLADYLTVALTVIPGGSVL